MKIYDLDGDCEYYFSHNDVVRAFAYVFAVNNKLVTQFVASPDQVIERVRGGIRKGSHGFHFLGLSMPFSSLN